MTFLLGAVNTLVVVWYLAIRELPAIESTFDHFLNFAVVATILGVPLSIAIGWLHLKRSPAFSSELDIGVEANPYYYKLPPGFAKEAYVPLYLELLMQLTRLLDAQDLLTDEDRSRIESLRKKLQLLIDGGFLGSPRTKL